MPPRSISNWIFFYSNCNIKTSSNRRVLCFNLIFLKSCVWWGKTDEGFVTSRLQANIVVNCKLCVDFSQASVMKHLLFKLSVNKKKHKTYALKIRRQNAILFNTDEPCIINEWQFSNTITICFIKNGFYPSRKKKFQFTRYEIIYHYLLELHESGPTRI